MDTEEKTDLIHLKFEEIIDLTFKWEDKPYAPMFEIYRDGAQIPVEKTVIVDQIIKEFPGFNTKPLKFFDTPEGWEAVRIAASAILRGQLFYSSQPNKVQMAELEKRYADRLENLQKVPGITKQKALEIIQKEVDQNLSEVEAEMVDKLMKNNGYTFEDALKKIEGDSEEQPQENESDQPTEKKSESHLREIKTYKESTKRPSITSSSPGSPNKVEDKQQSAANSQRRSNSDSFTSDVQKVYDMARHPGDVAENLFNHFKKAAFGPSPVASSPSGAISEIASNVVQTTESAVPNVVETIISSPSVSPLAPLSEMTTTSVNTVVSAGAAETTVSLAGAAATATATTTTTSALTVGESAVAQAGAIVAKSAVQEGSKVAAGVAVKGAVKTFFEAIIPGAGWALAAKDLIGFVTKGGTSSFKKLLSGFYDKAKLETKKNGVGGFLGGMVGSLGGAALGQILIPIPVVGALIGGILGAFGGSTVGDWGGKLVGAFLGLFGEDGWKKALGVGAALSALIGGVGTSSMTFFTLLGTFGLIFSQIIPYGNQSMIDSAFAQPPVGSEQYAAPTFSVKKEILTVNGQSVANGHIENFGKGSALVVYRVTITSEGQEITLSAPTDKATDYKGKRTPNPVDVPVTLSGGSYPVTLAAGQSVPLIMQTTLNGSQVDFDDSRLTNQFTITGTTTGPNPETQTRSDTATLVIGDPQDGPPYGFPIAGKITTLDFETIPNGGCVGNGQYPPHTHCGEFGPGEDIYGGIDIGATGTVKSTLDGYVESVGFNDKIGGFVIVDSASGEYRVAFLHLQNPTTIQPNEPISRGQILGEIYDDYVANPLKYAFGHHIHYQILKDGVNLPFATAPSGDCSLSGDNIMTNDENGIINLKGIVPEGPFDTCK